MSRASPDRRILTRPIPILLAAATLALAAACNSSNGGIPTAPGGPIIPTIGGTYSSPTMWRFELTSDSPPVTFVCAGSITITNQVAENFSGTFLISDPNCGSISGSLVAGVLGANGSVTFELMVPGANPNLFTAAFGCTYVSGDRGVTGTLIGTQLQAEARTAMECPQVGPASLFTRLSGSR